MSHDPEPYITDSTNDYRARPPAPCLACGAHAHGSEGVARHCLEGEIRRLRGLLAPILQLRAEVGALRKLVLP